MYQEIESRQQEVRETTGVRYFTTVIEKQTFGPDAGLYAGKSYRITSVYVSPFREHRGMFLKSSSQPWEE